MAPGCILSSCGPEAGSQKDESHGEACGMAEARRVEGRVHAVRAGKGYESLLNIRIDLYTMPEALPSQASDMNLWGKYSELSHIVDDLQQHHVWTMTQC